MRHAHLLLDVGGRSERAAQVVVWTGRRRVVESVVEAVVCGVGLLLPDLHVALAHVVLVLPHVTAARERGPRSSWRVLPEQDRGVLVLHL